MPNVAGTLNFSADRPISDLSGDLLGRGPFAVALANAITAWKGNDSLVLGIYGPWGSGKSSVKNMVISLLKHQEAAPSIIEFNPWEWSGDNRLLEVFFEEVETAIRKGIPPTDADDLGKQWKRYAARLALGSTALEHLKTAAEFSGVPWAPLVLGALSKLAKNTSEVSKQAAEAHEAASENESLGELKSSLRSSLAGLRSPVLVVIDDIDRLPAQEIKTLFRLVKINADFPNMIYLLLFDRTIVAKALDDASSDTGRNYMEKIIQAGFDLPHIQQEAIQQSLTAALEELFGGAITKRTYNEDRWHTLYLNGLQHYCSSLRKVRRFISSLSFQLGLYLHEGALEVNAIDLVGLEAIRVFEPSLYDTLCRSPETIFGDVSLLMTGNEGKEERVKRAERLLLSAHEKSRAAAKGVLVALFPQLDWLFRGYGYGQGFEAGWLHDLRICHQEIFERYFIMRMPHGTISQSLVDEVLALSHDRDSLRKTLLALAEQGKLVDLLRRLDGGGYLPEKAHAEPFTVALCDVGDELPTDIGGFFNLSSELFACHLIYHCLMQETDKSQRGKMLLHAFDITDGTWLPVRLVSLVEPKPNDNLSVDIRLLDDAAFEEAKNRCLNKIKRLSENDGLLGPRLKFYLWQWLRWGGGGELRSWVAKVAGTLPGALQILDVFVRQGDRPAVRGSDLHFELNVTDLAVFVDVEALKSILAPILGEAIPAELEELAQAHALTIQAAKAALIPGNDRGSAKMEKDHDNA
ncbi:MAG TPA: P-loop NTPase fold protein [Pirellulales bacterium]|nr:P-loop NTPase fold protein [Pirellulales bacterium]